MAYYSIIFSIAPHTDLIEFEPILAAPGLTINHHPRITTLAQSVVPQDAGCANIKLRGHSYLCYLSRALCDDNLWFILNAREGVSGDGE